MSRDVCVCLSVHTWTCSYAQIHSLARPLLHLHHYSHIVCTVLQLSIFSIIIFILYTNTTYVCCTCRVRGSVLLYPTPSSFQFVPDTHLVFSASKDKTLKCWDADKFELVSTLEVRSPAHQLCDMFISRVAWPALHLFPSVSLRRGTKARCGAWQSVMMGTQW